MITPRKTNTFNPWLISAQIGLLIMEINFDFNLLPKNISLAKTNRGYFYNFLFNFSLRILFGKISSQNKTQARFSKMVLCNSFSDFTALNAEIVRLPGTGNIIIKPIF